MTPQESELVDELFNRLVQLETAQRDPEAERLIAAALSGDPPDEIAEELRDLLEQVYFGGKKGRRPLTAVSEPL